MQFLEIKITGAGTWARDCELIILSHYKGFSIFYYKDEDRTYWKINCKGVEAYKVTSEEIHCVGYLSTMPSDGAFYKIENSPWIEELSTDQPEFFENSNHYVLRFYDDIVEVIASEFILEQLKEQPSLKIEEIKL